MQWLVWCLMQPKVAILRKRYTVTHWLQYEWRFGVNTLQTSYVKPERTDHDFSFMDHEAPTNNMKESQQNQAQVSLLKPFRWAPLCHRQNTCLEEMALRKCKILSNFFLPQNQSKGFKHAHAALEHHLNQTKIDIFFSAIFWDKLRGHFRMLKSQNISHALCAHFSWLRTARWDEKSGWWRCPKLDAKTLPNSQQPKRKNTQNVSKKTNGLNCKF